LRYLIVASGEIKDDAFARKIISEHRLIICADGGAEHLYRLNTIPQAIIGDLDSLTPEIRMFFQAQGVEVVEFPTHKDFTDTELAIEHAIALGATEISILGGLGGRMDHALANITLLGSLAKRGVQAELIDEATLITAVISESVLRSHPGTLFSIIPISATLENVTLEGAEYPLEGATMTMGSSLGVSNKFKNNEVKVSLSSGIALLILSRIS